MATAFSVLAVVLLCSSASPARKNKQTYQYPFLNPALPEDVRIDNLLSLMTVDEKIMSLHGMGVPRLGVPSPGSTEAIHGIVRGGSTDLAPLHGSRDGEEVVQLYIKFSGDDAAKRLRGFERVAVGVGETRRVEIVVPEEDLTLWSVESHSFAAPKGEALVLIGSSSSDTRLSTEITL